LTLDWGMLRLAWNGYSAGTARIREVETLLVLLLSNDDSPPGEAEPGDGDAPCPPSSAQESQRFPWLPDLGKPADLFNCLNAFSSAGLVRI